MESPDVMRRFLLWLGEDEDSGARKYEEIRQKLILLFRHRGCHVPEELADQTIERTAPIVLKPDFHYQGEPIAYFCGVGRNVYREWLRKEQRHRSESISEPNCELPAHAGGSATRELIHDCLERCLNTLPPAKKSLLIRYYGSEKRAKIDDRKLLAKNGKDLNALRIQVFRLRNKLRACVEDCSAKDEILSMEQT